MRLLGVSLALLLAAPVAHAASSPFSPQHQMLGRGVALVVQGKYAEAEPVLRQAIDMDPGMPEAHYNLGVALKHTGHPAEAVHEFQVALGQYAPNDIPNRSKCLYGIALVQEDRDSPARAAEAWDDYIRFARRYRAEQPAVQVAIQREQAMRTAAREQPRLGPSQAARPTERE